jgi:hypothetical protein
VARATFQAAADGGCPLWNEPRALSQREALVDLRQLAAWAPHERIVNGRRIRLARGDLVISVRQAAERWRWSTSRVQRFLRRLTELGYIARRERSGDGDIYHVEMEESCGPRCVLYVTEFGPLASAATASTTALAFMHRSFS